MLCLSAFELYSRWVPLFDGATALLAQTNKAEGTLKITRIMEEITSSGCKL